MNLDKAIKLQCAAALDSVADLVEGAGATAEISIVVSHPNEPEGEAIIVGSHTLADLARITAGMAQRGNRTGTVTAEEYVEDAGSMLQ